MLREFWNGLKDLDWTSSDKLTIVPGNHDIFPGSTRSLTLGLPGSIRKEFNKITKPCRKGILLRGQPYPLGKKLSSNAALVAMDSTRQGALNLFQWAAGELPWEHVVAAREFFTKHRKVKHRIIVIHHCPWLHENASQSRRFPMHFLGNRPKEHVIQA